MEYIKIQFLNVPKRAGYFAGRTYLVPKKKAQSYVSQGYAVMAEMPLPDDFPHRERLIQAGLDTVQSVRDEADLTRIDRIGKKAADEIETYLSNL